MNNDAVIVLGCHGMLGADIVEYLKERAINVIALGRNELDITDEVAVNQLISDEKPKAVINCVAYTDVAGAESFREEALRVNRDAVKILAGATHKNESRLIHFSTDYVFDGFKNTPYVESDNTFPLNFYGKTKLEGEKCCLGCNRRSVILRLQWLYGWRGGRSFIHKIIARIKSQGLATVVTDQIGCPTSTMFVARIVHKILENDRMTGLYHLSHDDSATWYDFAKEAAKLLDYEESSIHPIERMPSTVSRPTYTRMSNDKLKRAIGSSNLGSWKDEIATYLHKYGMLFI